MPTYEYRCGNCGHHFEKFSAKMTDSKGEECPKCESVAERLISVGAVLLNKGSGFYTTDYRSDSYKKAEKKDKGETGPKTSSGKDKEKKSTSAKDNAPKKG
jgi:putative FmdB family regulatory protein